ncbi:MAG TPA: PadR family transcriptional regulator [Mycobacteriales bacterium]|nr:PadR family transcriptional regulator [Mycobacteriales bacterium]
MSIPHGLLALLDEGPRYGYQLRSDFELRTGGTWPLNVGQVYTTLGRLERDGLVEAAGEDDEGRAVYRITAAGSRQVRDWFTSPVSPDGRPRDELAIKLAMAVTVPGVDVATVVQAQRTATLRQLQELQRSKARSDPDDLARLLVLESQVFKTEAEARWLDHCEHALSTARTRSRPSAGTVGTVLEEKA